MLNSRKNQIIVVASIIIISVSVGWVFGPSILAQFNLESNQNNLEHPWVITIDGLVDTPLNISYDELLEMPNITVRAKLRCVDDVFDIGSITANWTGVQLSYLLSLAGVQNETIKVAFYAIDGFTTDLTIETANRSDIIIAYAQDGLLIPESGGKGAGGAPLRLVVPGKWGYKWIQWLSHIELVDYDFLGFYESNGYSDEADIP